MSNPAAALLATALRYLASAAPLTLWDALIACSPARLDLQGAVNACEAHLSPCLDLTGEAAQRVARAALASLGGQAPALAPTGPACTPDDLEWGADAARAELLARGAAAVEEALAGYPDAEGPAEVVALHLATLAGLTEGGAAAQAPELLAGAEVVYKLARAALLAWCEAAGCADLTEVREFTGEVCAALDCASALDLAKARLLDVAAGVPGGVYRRLTLAA
jgi:hypothetical protein